FIGRQLAGGRILSGMRDSMGRRRLDGKSSNRLSRGIFFNSRSRVSLSLPPRNHHAPPTSAASMPGNKRSAANSAICASGRQAAHWFIGQGCWLVKSRPEVSDPFCEEVALPGISHPLATAFEQAEAVTEVVAVTIAI